MLRVCCPVFGEIGALQDLAQEKYKNSRGATCRNSMPCSTASRVLSRTAVSSCLRPIRSARARLTSKPKSKIKAHCEIKDVLLVPMGEVDHSSDKKKKAITGVSLLTELGTFNNGPPTTGQIHQKQLMFHAAGVLEDRATVTSIQRPQFPVQTVQRVQTPRRCSETTYA